VSLYLDASVLLPRLIEEPDSDAVAAWLLAERRELLVSDFAVAEVASGISRLVRMRLLAAEEAVARLDEFEIWRAATTSPIDLHAADARLAYLLVRRFELMLRTPDAVHLAMARRLDATLVTLDRRLQRAAADLDIAIETPQP
jgi:predicted nucleic acid-binding protein